MREREVDGNREKKLSDRNFCVYLESLISISNEGTYNYIINA